MSIKPGWREHIPNHILCYDVESSGIRTEEDRIIQAFLGLMDRSGDFVKSQTWLIDPGVEIPDGAAAVHGYTTERLQAEATHTPEQALREIRQIIVGETQDDADPAPLVAYNAAYDASLTDAELRRHGLPPIRYGAPYADPRTGELQSSTLVFDPHVCDKALDRYRKGKRTLTATCPVYGVHVEENAHDAGADCLMAGRLAWRLMQPILGTQGTMSAVHQAQARWRLEQAAGLEFYLRHKAPADKRNPDAEVDGRWPLYRDAQARADAETPNPYNEGEAQ